MEQEIWKPIKGFEGFYEISNFGRVKSLERTYKTRNNKTWHVSERFLKITPFHGYPAVVLSKNSVCSATGTNVQQFKTSCLAYFYKSIKKRNRDKTIIKKGGKY